MSKNIHPIFPVKKLSKAEGELLTIIDSVIPQGKQCESVKSLVRQVLSKLYAYCDFGKEKLSGQTD